MTTDPDDFDPLALIAAEAHPEAHPAGPAFETPFDIDRLASPQPGETPADTIRAAIAAASVGANAPAARAVRTPCPARGPLPPPPPYPFDGKDLNTRTAVQTLAAPFSGQTHRLQAAVFLVSEYETRHGAPLSLPVAVSWWWKSARRVSDLPALHNRPGLSPNAIRMRALRAAAEDFATALRIPSDQHRAEFEKAGIPMPPAPRRRPRGGGVPR